MKKIYLFSFSIAVAFSGLSQSTAPSNAKKAIAEPINEPFDLYKKKNAPQSSRATSINRWVSFDDAQSTYYTLTAGLTRMSNGPISNGANVHMGYLSSGVLTVDTIFTFGAYSLIDLNGTWYRNTYFNPASLPFAPDEDLTVDSVAVGFVYVKHDAATIDTAVVRIATPSTSPAQMQSAFRYNPPNHTASGDTARWLGVTFNPAAKEIANRVVEVKIPLTNAFVADQNNWRGTDSTSFFVDAPAGVTISNHDGLLAVEVSIIHGKQLTSADTVGVNANWFSPLYLTMDGQGTLPPPYDRGDYTCGGVLYSAPYLGTTTNAIYYSHWFGNSDNQLATGPRDPFQSAWVNLKITQNNSYNVGTEELTNDAKLLQNFPNPTSGFTTVKYSLENQAQVTFDMIDITGKKVMTIAEGNKTAGVHTIEINTDKLTSGIYFYSVTVDGNRITKKMTVTK